MSEAIGQDEYASKKQALLNQKADLKEKLATLEADTANRFEPVEEFLKALKQAAFLASQGSEEEKRDFLKKIGFELHSGGSNPFRGVQKPLEMRGEFHFASPRSKHVLARFILEIKLAEREGFEPSVQFPVHRFSKPAL